MVLCPITRETRVSMMVSIYYCSTTAADLNMIGFKALRTCWMPSPTRKSCEN